MSYVIGHKVTTEEMFIDFYCGAGGSSSGLKKAGLSGRMAANHNELAIASHNTNHPEMEHVMVDLLEADPANFPYAVIAWFSPECTYHSNGRGEKRKGQSQIDMFSRKNPDPEAERSRVTMWDVCRFSQYHRYQVVIVENVCEIKDWVDYEDWLAKMVSLGYEYKICYFNSRFFHPLNGCTNYAAQNRDRIYIVFWRRGNRAPNLDFRPWAWCGRCGQNVQARQVFKKAVFPLGWYDTTGSRGQYYYACPTCQDYKSGQLWPHRVEPYYYAAANIIDWSLPCPPIGERKQPLKPNTVKRIQIGLEKFGQQPLVVQMARSHAQNNRSIPVTMPVPTVDTCQSVGMVLPGLVVETLYTGETDRSTMLHEALPTATTRQSLAFVVPMKGPPQDMPMRSASKPFPMMTTVGAPAIVEVPLLMEMYGGGDLRTVGEPVPTVTAGGVKAGVFTFPFIVSYYSRDDASSPVSAPLPTVVTEPRFALVKPLPFLMSYYNGSDGVHGVDNPVYTVTTRDRHSLVIPETIDIGSCGFRMMEPHESKLAQGFDRDYVILGTDRQQVKQIGNAVSDPVAEFLGKAAWESLRMQ